MKKYLLAIFLVFYALTAVAANKHTSEEIDKVSNQWAMALSSGDPEKVASLYDKNALLYATFKNKIDNHHELVDYFKNLMKHPNLRVQFQKIYIRVFWETAVNSGLYTFSYNEKGKVITVPARYTFVYVLEPEGWMILDHHSSVLPDKE